MQLHLRNVANLNFSADLVLAGSKPATASLEPDDEVASCLLSVSARTVAMSGNILRLCKSVERLPAVAPRRSEEKEPKKFHHGGIRVRGTAFSRSFVRLRLHAGPSSWANRNAKRVALWIMAIASSKRYRQDAVPIQGWSSVGNRAEMEEWMELALPFLNPVPGIRTSFYYHYTDVC